MRIDGGYLFPAPAELLYAALVQPATLARAIPGTERLIQLGPPGDDGSTTYKAWVRGSGGLAVLTWCLTPVQRPDSLRLDLWGHLPGGHLDGTGMIDLVAYDDAHARGAYTVELAAPETALDAPAGQALAQVICKRLADVVYAQETSLSESASPLAPGPALSESESNGIVTPRGRIVALPVAGRAQHEGVRAWAERAAWLVAGLALGLAAVGLVLAVAHRLNGHDT